MRPEVSLSGSRAYSFDWSLLVGMESAGGDSAEDARLIREDGERARAFLLGHAWCERLGRGFWGGGIGGLCTVWLFEVVTIADGVDPWVWAVVGDIPSAYIRADRNPTAVDALRDYIREMGRWVAAARYGQDVSSLIPVNAAATPETADLLDRRLTSLERLFLNSGRGLLP